MQIADKTRTYSSSDEVIFDKLFELKEKIFKPHNNFQISNLKYERPNNLSYTLIDSKQVLYVKIEVNSGCVNIHGEYKSRSVWGDIFSYLKINLDNEIIEFMNTVEKEIN